MTCREIEAGKSGKEMLVRIKRARNIKYHLPDISLSRVATAETKFLIVVVLNCNDHTTEEMASIVVEVMASLACSSFDTVLSFPYTW